MRIWPLITVSLFGIAAGKASTEPTFSKDVAPILYAHCVTCHRPNDIAPMSLVTYHEARPWAAAIREAVLTRKMPPWHADPRFEHFSNDARLSETEVAVLAAWAKSGAKQGDARDLPRPPQFEEGWHIKPDYVATIPEANIAESADSDRYVYVYVATPFQEDKWIQAAEVLPGDRRIVHHATVSILPSTTKLGVESKPGDQYRYTTGGVLHIRPEVPVENDGCSVPGGGALPGEEPDGIRVPAIYLPGHMPEVRPDGYALKLAAGSVLEFQIHYHNRTGKALPDRTSIGFVFAAKPPEHEVKQYEIWNNMFAIPPGDANHRVTSCYTLDRDVEALAYTAHMHYRGKSMRTEAVFPDGRRETLFSVPNYDFRWQETYFLQAPRVLPKGTRLVTTAFLDNSPNNPLNPDPTRRIRWGEPSDEEMVGFWLQFAEVSSETHASKRIVR